MTPVDHRYVSGNECPHRHAVGENDGVGQEVAIFGFVAYKGAPAPAIGARRRDIDGASARPALQCVDHVLLPERSPVCQSCRLTPVFVFRPSCFSGELQMDAIGVIEAGDCSSRPRAFLRRNVEPDSEVLCFPVGRLDVFHFERNVVYACGLPVLCLVEFHSYRCPPPWVDM